MTQNYFPDFELCVTNQNVTVRDRLYVPRSFSCYCSVVKASIPVTFYNLKGNSLVFTYRVVGDSTNRPFIFNVPAGYYSSSDIADVCTWSGTLPGTSTFSQLFCSFQPPQNRFQFMFLPNSQLTMFALSPSTLATQLGFNNTVTDAFGTYFPNNFVADTSDYNYPLCRITFGDTQADLTITRNIHINTSNPVKHFGGSTNEIAVVPVDRDFNQVLQFDGSSYQAQLIDNVFKNFTVWFTDDSGNTLDFNGVAWSITLQFSFRLPDLTPFPVDATTPLLSQQILDTADYVDSPD